MYYYQKTEKLFINDDEIYLVQRKTADSTAWFPKPLVFTVYFLDLLSPKPLAVLNSHMICLYTI